MIVYRIQLHQRQHPPITVTRSKITHQIIRPHKPLIQAHDALPNLEVLTHGVVEPAQACLTPEQLRDVEHVPAKDDVAAETEEAAGKAHSLRARELQHALGCELPGNGSGPRVREDAASERLVMC